MTTQSTFPLGLQEQAIPLLVIAICLALAFLLLKWVARTRHRALTQERPGVNENSFARQLEKEGFDSLIARSAFRYLQDVQGVRFPILPSDDLDVDLGLDSADIQQCLNDLSSVLGRTLNTGLLHKPLVTVEDLVRVLQASPRAASGISAVA
jgi:acyl carrier protein